MMESIVNLPAFSISDILQMRAQRGETGLILFTVENVPAKVYLIRGQCVHIRFGDFVGQAAFHLLLQFGTAPYEWHEGATSPESSMFKSVESLLVDHAFLGDLTQEEICERFASDYLPKNKSMAHTSPLSVVASGAGFEAFRFDLLIPKIIVGRQVELCHLTIPDESVSSEHGVFFVNGQTIHYNDLGSTNGSWMDGKMISEAVLQPGQKLQLGMATLEIVDFSAIEKTPNKDETTRLDKYIKIPEKRLEPVSEGLTPSEVKKKLRSTSKVEVSPEIITGK